MKHGMVRWGMVGTGNVTERKSAPSFNKITGSRLVAVGNRNPEKAADYARRHGVPRWHRDPFDVISDPDVDVVYIATPPGSHMEYALETIRAGKPVYLEKPMARTWEECEEINRAAAEKGTPVYVAYYRRSLEYFLKIKEVIESGILGKILHLNLQQYFPAREEDHLREAPPWRVIPEISGGGYFHDVGCHALDILFYMFGDPLKVTGMASNRGALYEPPDTVAASLMLPGGLLLTGSWDFITPDAFQRDLVEVTGTEGRMEFSIFSFSPVTLYTAGQTSTFSAKRPEHIQLPFIRTIVEELNGTGSCPSSGTTAAVTSLAMDRILRKWSGEA